MWWIEFNCLFADHNECSSSPCLNGGTCTDRVNEYTCYCSPGLKGPQCQGEVFTLATTSWVQLNVWNDTFACTLCVVSLDQMSPHDYDFKVQRVHIIIYFSLQGINYDLV